MKNYFIVTSSDSKLCATVYARGVASPFDQETLIEDELRGMGLSGAVLFDLLLTNGHCTNRYFIADFNNGELLNYRPAPKMLYASFSNRSALALSQELERLNLILLSRAQKFAVKSGIAFGG